MDSLAPIPFLRDLREECLSHSERRMPKWKFRLAPDLVMQIQPQAYPASFRGIAVMVSTGNATAEMINGRSARYNATAAWWRRTFEVLADAPNKNEWLLWMGHGWYAAHRPDGNPVLIWRIRSAFTGDFFQTPAPNAFLDNNCLICGKALTDPASMSRRIGPECASGSAYAKKLCRVQPMPHIRRPGHWSQITHPNGATDTDAMGAAS